MYFIILLYFIELLLLLLYNILALYRFFIIKYCLIPADLKQI